MEGNSLQLQSLHKKVKEKLEMTFRVTQIGIVSYGNECPSHGVYSRVSEVKNWIQYIAEDALDSNCNLEIPFQPGQF